MSEITLKEILFTADGIKDKPMETDEQWELLYNKAAAERDKLQRQRDALLAAAKGVWKLLEDGQIVRQTNHDHEPDWAIKQIPVVLTLSSLEKAIKEAES